MNYKTTETNELLRLDYRDKLITTSKLATSKPPKQISYKD